MSPKNRKVDDSAGDDIADEDSFEDGSLEEGTDDDSFEDDYQDEDEDDAELEEDTEYEDGAEDEPQRRETPAEKRKRIDRVNASARAADIKPGQSNMSAKWTIDRLDEREKRFSFGAAGGAALFGVLYFLATHNHKSGIAKGQLAPELILILGLAAGALLVGTTILGRRAPVGFVALFTGAMFGSASTVLGLPFFALAVWLLYRSYKIQRDTNAQLREARGGLRARSSPARRPAASSRPPASPRPTTVAEARRARSKRSTAPVGNKRYTPKRPTPPPPKPSRRQRKAAAAD
jgi:hypothetical protein